MNNAKAKFDELIYSFGFENEQAPAALLAAIISFNDFDQDVAEVLLNKLIQESEMLDQTVSMVAKYQIGRLYISKLNNTSLGLEYVTVSANSGLALAQNLLGGWYLNEENAEFDLNKAIFWLEKAAAQGHTKSEGLLGCIYVNEQIDEEKGRKLIEKAAEKGSGNHCLIVALYSNEKNTDHYDLDKAIKFFKLAIESKDIESTPIANLNLGKIFEEHFADYKKAMALYQQAAVEGHPYGIYYQAFLYRNLNQHEQAFPLFCEAAEQATDNSQIVVSFYYREGIVTEKNVQKARDYLLAATAHPNLEVVRIAQYELGVLYNEEYDDEHQAYEWWEESAKRGFPMAMLTMSNKYAWAEVNPENYQKALYWHKKMMFQEHEDISLEDIEAIVLQIDYMRVALL